MGSINLKLKDGTQYTLAYNRSAIVRMEEMGFNPETAKETPMKTMDCLIKGAFIMHHPSISYAEIDNITSQISNVSEFVEALAELYKEALESIYGNKPQQEGNAQWGRN